MRTEIGKKLMTDCDLAGIKTENVDIKKLTKQLASNVCVCPEDFFKFFSSFQVIFCVLKCLFFPFSVT